MIALLEARRPVCPSPMVTQPCAGVVALPLAMAFAIASARPVLTDKLSVCIGCARLMPGGLIDE